MQGPVAVLCSGSLGSCVLLIDLARRTGHAVPLFVRAGHPWEEAERAAVGRFLDAVAEPAVAPPRDLLLPMGDVYGAPWSMSGQGAPGWAAPDEAVELVVIEEGDDASKLTFEGGADGCRGRSRKDCGDDRGHA